ncbi:MAG: iron-containing redox enzyme family protein [Pseudomonadota bacterium]|nr:iron-containing redox enzyme family protein [Pseudomonadota bacterium]
MLADNGIEHRYYATGPDGETRCSAAYMAAEAVRTCIDGAGLTLDDIQMLCTGTAGGDATLPGFANMVQGELASPPMATSSHSGVCAAGLAALEHAAMALDGARINRALVATSEVPSRLFKRSRFASRGYDIDFDAHFLRWMLSDAAGAWLLEREPYGTHPLQLLDVHLRSFGGDYPVCMQVGLAAESSQSYLDYESFAAAEADGAYALRQNIRLLPNLFDVAIHEYVRLTQSGWIDPARIDHFLCHYSSQRFAPVVRDLLDKAGLTIPDERWYSNLKWRGNTGAASIFVMLHDFLQDRRVKPGERILCFVPESSRFTVGYVLLEVAHPQPRSAEWRAPAGQTLPLPPPPHDPDSVKDPLTRRLLVELAEVWHSYRSRAWRSLIVSRITAGKVTDHDMLRWMEDWIPQVQQGSIWMRKAVAHLDDRFARLRELVTVHAGEEQYDFRILFDDYRRAGGSVTSIDRLQRNAGGEALNAYLHARAEQPNPVGLLGAMYVIEGTGQRIVPALLPAIRKQLRLPLEAVRFLHYHGENDVNHLARWLECAAIALEVDGAAAVDDIVATARNTAELYLMQLNAIRIDAR